MITIASSTGHNRHSHLVGGDAAAGDVLARAYAGLLAAAGRRPNTRLRHSFLGHPLEHGAMRSALAGLGSGWLPVSFRPLC